MIFDIGTLLAALLLGGRFAIKKMSSLVAMHDNLKILKAEILVWLV